MTKMVSHSGKVTKRVHGSLPARGYTERMLARQRRWEDIAQGVTDDAPSDLDDEVVRYVEAHGAVRDWEAD